MRVLLLLVVALLTMVACRARPSEPVESAESSEPISQNINNKLDSTVKRFHYLVFDSNVSNLPRHLVSSVSGGLDVGTSRRLHVGSDFDVQNHVAPQNLPKITKN